MNKATKGCPKKKALYELPFYGASFWNVSFQLAVEGRMPSNPVLQNGNSESAVFWDILYCANDFVENILR